MVRATEGIAEIGDNSIGNSAAIDEREMIERFSSSESSDEGED
ncbi:uncharacterized protein G2W53_008197 [Senna tora]|uniref:Uncharacterized protein n=1 Tax=Senna tora TaxID=362788 RepID=A0A835CGR1_9FABA|nr:uncharacterized protein G2W53_008197 [Senna tora]